MASKIASNRPAGETGRQPPLKVEGQSRCSGRGTELAPLRGALLWLRPSPELAPHWRWLGAGVCTRSGCQRGGRRQRCSAGFQLLEEAGPGRPGKTRTAVGRARETAFSVSPDKQRGAAQRGRGLSLPEGEEQRLLLSFLYPEHRLPGLPFAGHHVPAWVLLSARAHAEGQGGDLLSSAGHHVGYQGIHSKRGERCGPSRLTEKAKHL